MLVVGAGNSAFDIAIDLLSGDGECVWLSLRTPPHMVRRSILGLPKDVFAVMFRRLPNAFVDRGVELIRRMNYRDLEKHGVGRPPTGLKTHLQRTGMIPTIDPGAFARAIREERLPVVAAVSGFTADHVVLADGRTIDADAVIAATGYRPGLEALVGHLGVLNQDGWPTVNGAKTSPKAPKLHFIGFSHPLSGNLRELRLDARRIARAVAGGLRYNASSSSTAPTPLSSNEPSGRKPDDSPSSDVGKAFETNTALGFATSTMRATTWTGFPK